MVVVPSDCRVGRIKQLRWLYPLHMRITEHDVAVPTVWPGILENGGKRTAPDEQPIIARPEQRAAHRKKVGRMLEKRFPKHNHITWNQHLGIGDGNGTVMRVGARA